MPDATPTTDPLDLVALDIERHVAGGGWDQAVRLFALVPTTVLQVLHAQRSESADAFTVDGRPVNHVRCAACACACASV